MHFRSHRRCEGVTLLEIVTATALLSLLLVIGVPRLARLRGPYTLVGASRQVAADLQLARQRAIARNARYRITFSSMAYRLERETSPSSFVTEVGPIGLPHGALIGEVAPGSPVFDTRGMLAANVTVPITVSGIGTRTVTINVLGRTTIN